MTFLLLLLRSLLLVRAERMDTLKLEDRTALTSSVQSQSFHFILR